MAARPGRERAGLLYVVATQTVEVGANIDFDALVSESAPLDSLRQRFGRLNRLGREGEAKAVLILRPKEDLVYGEATRATWDFLTSRKPVDFGVTAMDELLSGVDLETLNSKASVAPLLFPGHLEWLVQTNPEPVPSPDVAPFLHGPDATEAADVQIVWREDITSVNEPETELVELMPPVQREALAMPLRAVRRWLKGQDLAVADVEGMVLAPIKEENRDATKKVLRWNSGKAELIKANDLRPGDTIVVPSSYGGADRFGWNPEAEFTPDIADAVNEQEADSGFRQRRVRLDVAAKTTEGLGALITQFRSEPDRDAEMKIVGLLGEPSTGAKVDPTGRLVTWPKRKGGTHADSLRIEPSTEETDETDDSSLIGKQSLAAHTAGVMEHAKKFALGCGMPAHLVGDIQLAARLHDWGKCDERFQAWLTGRPFIGGEYMAKSQAIRSKAERLSLREKAGYPPNARHEAGSVMAAFASGLLSEAHDQELVLYLIGTHHGCGRPLFPVWDDAPGFSIAGEVEGIVFESTSGRELARFDSGWVDRFELLNRRYGYWGLAYLEAILRRADCMQSRKEEWIA